MDDRMLLAIMDLLLDDLDTGTLQYDLWYGATVQEEGGLHGAKAMAHLYDFDLAIALDVGLVGDVPTVEEKEYATHLGGGPTLVHKDSGIHSDRRLLWRLADVAKANALARHSVRYCSGSQSVYMAKFAPPLPRKNSDPINHGRELRGK